MCRPDGPVNRNSPEDLTSSICQFNCAASQPTNRIAVDLNPGAKSIRTLLILARRWCEAKVVQSRPIQVAQDQALLRFALSCFDQRHLRGKIFPAVAVVDESVDPFPELRVYRIMEFALPPKIKWQVRIQIGEDDTRQL